MLKNSYLSQTGQLWKLQIGLVGLIAGGILALADWFYRWEFAFLCTTVGIALGLCSLVWLILSIRCPTCRTRLVWRAMSRAKHNRWLFALSSSICPVCR